MLFPRLIMLYTAMVHYFYNEKVKAKQINAQDFLVVSTVFYSLGIINLFCFPEYMFLNFWIGFCVIGTIAMMIFLVCHGLVRIVNVEDA